MMKSRTWGVNIVGTVAVTALLASATACIFEEGSYKGGGRLDTASTAEQNEGTSSGTSGTPTDDDDDDNTTNPVIDSGSTSGGVDAGAG